VGKVRIVKITCLQTVHYSSVIQLILIFLASPSNQSLFITTQLHVLVNKYLLLLCIFVFYVTISTSRDVKECEK